MGEKRVNYKKRLILLEIASFITSVAPLLITLIVRWDKYATTTAGTFKLCIGGIILMIFVILKVIGKLKMPRRVVTYAVVLLLAYLLKAIMDDLILLSAMALLGEFIDMILWQREIKKMRRQMEMDEQGDVTADKVREVLKEMGVGNG